MKTIKQVLETTGISESLIRSTLRQVGDKDSLRDVYAHGASGGFCGFCYYSDTVAFYKRNRAEIVALAKNMADDLGESLIAMIAGFNCLKTSNPQERRDLEDEIGRALYGRITDKETQVANALAWFALEEVARAFCD
jgi:hypothetical protein